MACYKFYIVLYCIETSHRICCFAVETSQAAEFTVVGETVQFREIHFKTNAFIWQYSTSNSQKK